MATAKNSAKSAGAAALKANEKKWTKLLMDGGWTAIPSVIVEHQQELGLDAIDINILLYLSTHWWEADDRPRPAKGTVANAIGIHPRTVQRRVTDLVQRGLIRREEVRISGKGSKPNIYHFDGLIEKTKPFAEEKLKLIAERTKAKAARTTKPPLKLVKS